MKELNERYYEHFKCFLENYKRQYFKAKMQNDMSCILEIKENIWKNWNLSLEQKKRVLYEIGLVE